MRLTSLTAAGVHGRLSYNEQLEPVVVVVGPNGSGKSSFVGLARLVLNGPTGAAYPVLGTSPTYDWSVTAMFDRFQVGRWMRGGEHKASFNGIGGKLREVQTQIDASVGRAASWNLEAFLADTPSKRQAFLEAEVLRGAGWPAERVWKELGTAEATREAILAALTRPLVEAPDGRVLLTSILAALRNEASEQDAEARRLLPLVRQDELDEAKAGTPSGTVAGWREKVTGLDDRIAPLRERRGEIHGRKAAREELARRLAQAEAALASHLETDWGGRLAAQVARTDDAIAARDTALRAGEEAARAHTEAGTRKAELQAAYDTAVAAAARARAAVPPRTLPGELALLDLNEEPRAVVVINRETGDTFTTRTRRPGGNDHALTDDGDGIDLDRYALFDVRSLTALAPFIEQAITSSSAPVLDLTPVEAAARAAEQERDAAKVRLDAAVRAERAASERLQATRTDFATKRGAAETEERILAQLRADIAGAGEKEATLRGDIERLASEVGASLDGQLEALDEEIRALEEERAEAQRKADALSDAAGAVARRIDNRTDLTRAQERRTRARQLAGIVESSLSAMLAELVSPLEEPVSRITRTVLGADFRVRLDGGATFWLVWPDHEAPLAASRSEQVVAMMALRCAVQQHLNGWRHLVLDDMENLAGARRTRFVEAMLDEVREGRLDNFIGACVEDGWSPPAGAQTIRRSL